MDSEIDQLMSVMNDINIVASMGGAVGSGAGASAFGNPAASSNGFDSLPCVVFAKICSYLPVRQVLCKVPQVSKQMARIVRQQDLFWKAFNADMNEYNKKLKSEIDLAHEERQFDQVKKLQVISKRITNFIIDQQLLNTIELEQLSHLQAVSFGYQCDLYRVFKILKINYDQSKGKDIELMPLAASSTDYNQSVHRSINRLDPNQFWSSGPSPSPDASEWLTYKVPIHTFKEIGAIDLEATKLAGANTHQLSLRACTIIRKFMVKVFDPANMQHVDFLYAPYQVQIEVGDSPDCYTYRSKPFAVNRQSAEEQEFDLSPDLCCGRYIRINLIGKPGKQNTDGQHYVAISYVGIQGVKLDQLVFDKYQTQPQTSVPQPKKQEEQKQMDDGDQQQIYEKSALADDNDQIMEESALQMDQFEKKLLNLILKSNKLLTNENAASSKSVDTSATLDDTQQIKDLIDSNYQVDLKKQIANMMDEINKKQVDETKEGHKEEIAKLQAQLCKYLFENREQVLIQFDDLFEELSTRTILQLYRYAMTAMGISSQHLTKIVLTYMVKTMQKLGTEKEEKENWFEDFVSQLRHITGHSGGAFVEKPSKGDLDDIFDPKGVHSDLLTQKQKEDVLVGFQFFQEYFVFQLKHNVNMKNNSQHALILMRNIFMSHSHHGHSVDYSLYYTAYLKHFGKTSQNIEQLRQLVMPGFFVTQQMYEQHTKVLDAFQKQVDQEREAQMSAMYC